MNIEFDLKEILTEIKQEFGKFDTKLDRLEGKVDKVAEDLNEFKSKVVKDITDLRTEVKEDITDLKTDVKEDINELKMQGIKSDNEIKAEIRVLAERINGISKRVDTQEFINRGVIIGLVLAVLGGFAKIFGLA